MIGLDAVDISRFEHWAKYNRKQLQKIFHENEIDYAFSNSQKTAERLAARFAAKEAFYKALSSVTDKKYSLWYICQNVRVSHKENGAPYLIVNPNSLELPYHINLTITHTDKTAIALVMLIKN